MPKLSAYNEALCPLIIIGGCWPPPRFLSYSWHSDSILSHTLMGFCISIKVMMVSYLTGSWLLWSVDFLHLLWRMRHPAQACRPYLARHQHLHWPGQNPTSTMNLRCLTSIWVINCRKAALLSSCCLLKVFSPFLSISCTLTVFSGSLGAEPAPMCVTNNHFGGFFTSSIIIIKWKYTWTWNLNSTSKCSLTLMHPSKTQT